MRSLVTLNPSEEIRAMETLFNQIWGSPVRGNQAGNVLPIDVLEQNGAVVIRASVPGISPESLDISVENSVLTIRGENPAPEMAEDGKVYFREIPYGSFSRSLRLPKNLNLEAVDAQFSHGIVTITLPKVEPEKPQPLKIEVRTAEPGSN